MVFALLLLAALSAAVAVLNFRPAPPCLWAWKTAIAAGEFGHWLALLPLGTAALAAGTLDGAGRATTVALAAFAAAGLLRPAAEAWRLGRRLGPGAFSWRRLYLRAAEPAATVATETYAQPDGTPLRLDFQAAARDAARGRDGRAPCLVVIHGGGWDSGDRTQLADWNARWAARGWAVASLDYRLAPRHPWPAAGDDVRAALAWLKAESGRLGLDPTRFVLLGRSAGGQIATAVAYGADDPALRGVIALYSPHDMPFAWSVSREDDTLNSIRLFRQYLGGPPDTPARAALYASASGQGLARAGGPPALLLHGYPDTLVWHRHSRRMAARLAEVGVACTHLELPWATHAFDFNPDGPGGQIADFAIARFLAAVR